MAKLKYSISVVALCAAVLSLLDAPQLAVAQSRQIDSPHVFEADVVATFEQSPHFRGQCHRLGGTRAGAPA